MSTAYQLYNRPDPLEDEPEPHSWDGEIRRLRRTYGDQPFPSDGIQQELEEAGSLLVYENLPPREQNRLYDLAENLGYRKAVKQWLDEREER